jgi:predicted O-linked N-acetylglucosamine transferase (SPINDLY family)
VLDLWARVLRAVPRSRLLLKGKWLNFPDFRTHLRDQFARRGVGRERIELLAETPATAEHLATYHRVDIALDTFPYNGTTTSCEALWMGVPVVTLVGDRHAARVGASLLSRVGLDELVAKSEDAYVATAARLATDLAALGRLRCELRPRLAASPLCDGAGFARQLEATYRSLWREWCTRR